MIKLKKKNVNKNVKKELTEINSNEPMTRVVRPKYSHEK
jgi:hypothetical protein